MEDVQTVLEAIHLVSTMEAIRLSRACNLDLHDLHKTLEGAAGASAVFNHNVMTHLRSITYANGQFLPLANNEYDTSRLSSLLPKISNLLYRTRSELFPTPMLASAHQSLLEFYNVSKVTDATSPRSATQAVKTNGVLHDTDSDRSVSLLSSDSTTKQRISFLGLGAMGSGMATALIQAGFPVTGYDLYKPSLDKFAQNGGLIAKSVAEATGNADLIIMMVQSAAQIDSLLFDDPTIEKSISKGCTLLVMSTVPPAYIKSLGKRLSQLGIEVVDAPVSGGVARAAAGDLLIMASGSEAALASSSSALQAMSGRSENLRIIKGGLGAGSSVKMLNQLLAGTNIVASAEAMALAAHRKLDTTDVYKQISGSPYGSWMFTNRVPAMLEADWTPHSAVAIFVKDMGIVTGEAAELGVPVPLANTACQLYLQAGADFGVKDMDSSIVRLWRSVSVSDAASK